MLASGSAGSRLCESYSEQAPLSQSTQLPCKIKDYVFYKPIGHGGFSEVFLVSHSRFDKEFVAKVMTFDLSELDSRRDSFESEVQALLNLHHPNIIRLYDHFHVGAQFFLILEYCPSGSLRDEIIDSDGLTLPRFIHLATEIIGAIAYCHSQNIAHRDIKPGNILLDSRRNSRLADFGLSLTTTAGRKFCHFAGSRLFTAPEIVQKRPHDPLAGDVWALGVMFSMMITGFPPWPCDCFGEIRQQAAQGSLQFARPIPKEIEDLIRRMVVVDPEGRLTMEQVHAHPFFQTDGSRNLVGLAGQTQALQWNQIRRVASGALEGGSEENVREGRYRNAQVMSVSAALTDGRHRAASLQMRLHSKRPQASTPGAFRTFSDDIVDLKT
jgi:serine/threonine protein kinase